MYCARCGTEVGEQARECPSCGADLWGSGALRLTSTSEPAQSLDDVFAEAAPSGARGATTTSGSTGQLGIAPGTEGLAQPPAEWFTDPVVTRTQPRQVADEDAPARQRFVPMPDPDQATWLRIRSAVVVGAAILVAGLLLWVFHHLVTNTFTRDAAPLASRSATPTPARPSSAAPAPTRRAPTPSAAPSTRHVTGTIPASAKDCGKGVGAGSGTSCEFARAVADKVPSWPKDTFTITAKSPRTGNTYTVKCTAGAMTVCTGGRSVLIYVLK